MNALPVDLERNAANGDLQAQLLLGRAQEDAGSHAQARAWYGRAAAGGSLQARTALGISLLLHDPISPYDGVKAIIEAANGGCAQAAHLVATMAAAGSGIPQDWNVALNALRRSAELGWPLARAELALLAGEPQPDPSAPPQVWRRLQDKIDLSFWALAPAVRSVYSAPRIGVIENCLPGAICGWLVERARPMIERARVYDAATGDGRLDTARSNSVAEFNIADADVIVALARARIAAITGLPTMSMEHTSVLHYAVGQQFAPHYDFLDAAAPGHKLDMARRGQRVATFLVYLSDDFEEGQTAFLELDWKYRGRTGDAILFWNVDVSGAPDLKTRHAGLAPTRGEKWLLSQWIREPRNAAT